MAHLLCKCGNHLSNSGAVNEIQYHVYSDLEWQKILEKDKISPLELPDPKHDVWKCPLCERIYIFSNEGRVIKQYKLEKG